MCSSIKNRFLFCEWHALSYPFMVVDGIWLLMSCNCRSRSKLQVRRLKEDDAGLYQCQALNVVGQSDRSGVDVVVVPSESE